MRYGSEMSTNGLGARLDRLDRLQALLADGEAHHVCELAHVVSVSERTIARDLALLRKRGIALEGEAGPGGGVRAPRHAGVGETVLREADAIELLLALAVSEVLGVGFVSSTASLRSSVARAFAPADRVRISHLRSRIWVASPVSDTAKMTKRREQTTSRSVLQRAFFMMNRLEFDYEDGAGKATRREVEPQYMLWAWPFWYLLCWDVNRQAARTFRLDRVRNAVVLPLNFRMRSAALFKDSIAGVGTAL
ncbi:MAG: WYL domain-containing protein [Polaromonas sp.]|nr:WYL domain-containing protein [Polaromonas sp.]